MAKRKKLTRAQRQRREREFERAHRKHLATPGWIGRLARAAGTSLAAQKRRKTQHKKAR